MRLQTVTGVSLTSLQHQAESLGVVVRTVPLPKGVCGAYFKEYKTIALDDTLQPHQLRCTLCHELIHAEYEDTTPNAYEERRARKLAASRLIYLDDYIEAENVYEGSFLLMARELDVTKQVLEDYRELVLPQMHFFNFSRVSVLCKSYE